VKKIILIPIILAALAIVSFSASTLESTEKPSILIVETIDSDTTPIRIGTIGDSATKLILRFQPTADYLAENLSDEQTQYSGKVVIAETIDSMITLLNNNEIDVFVESPLTTVAIMENSEIEPSLIRWKQNSQSYHTLFLSHIDSNIKSISDYNIETWVFETKESTSGYLLPLAHMSEQGIFSSSNEKNQNFVFSGEDKNTPVWLIEGKGDVGVMSNLDYEELPVAIKDELQIIDQTIDVSRHVVSINLKLDSTLSEKISDVLLDMENDPQGVKIMSDFKDTKKYSEYDSAELDIIQRMLDLIPIGIQN
jgi:phosphonate transport system substrate-binding protein